jgi:hypothetical protein
LIFIKKYDIIYIERIKVKELMLMYNLIDLTEEQVSIILQALTLFQYENPYISNEQFEIANSVVEKIDEIIA